MRHTDYIPELAEALQHRTLALFTGADLPRAVTGLPSRADLARELARRKGLDESLSLAQVAQRVSQAGNRWEFTALIRDALDTTNKSPHPFHWRIIELVKTRRVKTLITTAYDNLLELAFQEVGVGFNRVVHGSDVAFIRPNRPTLVKLYGDAQQPNTLVVTEDDHYGLWRDRDREDLLDEVRSVLRRNTVLFLGYNLTDPDFNLLWREVLDRVGRFALGAYAVWTDLPEDERRVWADRHVRIIEAEPLALLERLMTAVSGEPTQPPDAKYAPRMGALSASASGWGQVSQSISPAPPTGPIHNRWALLVGVNQYVDPAFPSLKFCVNDVLALERTLKGLDYTVVALHDEADEERLLPTRDNVEAELARLAQVAGPDDLLLAHFACHGKLVNGQPVLVTRETRAPTLAKKALPLAEVERQMRESDARRLVLTLDACHTGVEIGRDLADPEFIRNAYELAEGFALIAASTAQQTAQEWEETEHGVFTYYLLEGLSGQADRAGKGFVTVDDLKTHVLDGLRRWSVERGGVLQEPTARTEGLGDIILADYRD